MTTARSIALVLTMCLGSLASRAEGSDRPLYRFVAGDTVRISVPSHGGWDQQAMVQPDGRIYYPLAGEIAAAGMTVPELRERIRAALETQLEQPMVTVSLVSSREGNGWVTVLGAAANAGRLEPRADWTLAEALTAAAVLPEADLSGVEIIREGRLARKVDVSSFRATGKIEEVIPIAPGDILVIPAAPRATVAVLGQVAKPGLLPWTKGMTVLDALSAAGGATPRAALARSELSRSGAGQPLDLDALLSGNPTLNVELRPGDALVVPESRDEVFVFGRVTRPSAYPLGRGKRVLDLLMEAGGPLPDASLAGARLLRLGADGKPEVIDLNLERIVSRGDLQGNQALRPNDILVVPQRGKSRSLRDALDWVWPVNTLYSLLRVLR